MKNCPSCNISWQGKDIYQHFIDEGHTADEALEIATRLGWTKEAPTGMAENMEKPSEGILRCTGCKTEFDLS